MVTLYGYSFGRDDLDINKKFFLAHLPPLEKKHYESIVNWFLDNRKTNDSIKEIFDTARNYFHLEDDDKSPFKKITSANDYASQLNLQQMPIQINMKIVSSIKIFH